MAPEPTDDQPVRKAIDSTVMLVLARFFMPTVVAVLGALLMSQLNDLKADSQQMRFQLSEVAKVQAATTEKVSGAVKQLDHLQTQVDGLPRGR